MQNKIQNDILINDPTQMQEEVLGENQKLLILHQEYNKLTEGETKQELEEKLR